MIKPGKPWRTLDEVEIGTAEWVDWYNNHRLYQYCGDIPPAVLENHYYNWVWHSEMAPLRGLLAV